MALESEDADTPSEIAPEAEPEAEMTTEEDILEGQPLLQAAQTGAFAVTGGAYGTDYTYGNGILTVPTDTPLTIAMADPGATTTTDSIVVKSSSMAHITIESLSIDRSKTGDKDRWGTAAFDVQSGGAGAAGVGNGADARGVADTIVVDGATLTAIAGSNAAAIGGGKGTGAYGLVVKDGYLRLERGSGAEYIGRGPGSAVQTDRTITGGYFVVGDERNNTVYGMAVTGGYEVENIVRLHAGEYYSGIAAALGLRIRRERSR